MPATFSRGKVLGTFKLLSVIVVILIELFAQTGLVSAAPSLDQNRSLIHEHINYFNVCDGSGGNDSNNSSQVDLGGIVSKYHLQSAAVQKVGGEIAGSYNADKSPITPASTMKLIIADTLIRSGTSLSSRVKITSDMVYGPGYSAGDEPTLGDAMTQMLRVSSNTAANGIISALGGFSAITSKAQSYGYTNTDINSYYSNAGDAVNKSTIGDEVSAMNHIYTTSSPGYSEAQQDLEGAAQIDNYYGVADDANKWAGTSQVAGNVAKLNINASDYIIGQYIEESDSAALSSGDIKNSTVDIAAAVKESGSDDSASTLDSSSGDSSGSCSCSGSTGTEASGSISPGVGKGMSAAAQQKFQQIMVAAGQKFGVNPNFIATFYYIEDGLAGGDSTNNADSASAPPRTGDGNWKEPPPPYGHGPPYPAPNSYSATGPFQFIDPTWAQYGVDGNGDGRKDVNDLTDAAFAAAKYLAALGAGNNTTDDAKLQAAAQGYNHSSTYAQSAVNTFHYLTGKGSSTVSSSSSDCSDSSAQTGKVAAAVAAAKLLSSYKVGYIWGGGHPAGAVAITDPSRLVAQGMDCSGSVAWVIYQAGLDPGLKNSGVGSSTELESWGEHGPGQELTVWANSEHAFLEFNVPGLGHYEMDTVNAEGNSTANTKTPDATGPGPRFFKVGDNGRPGNSTSGFTPRHFEGT